MSEIINQIMLDDIHIPGLPDVALRVVAALENEYCSIQTLEEIIYQDPSLTATILKIGNAPLYRTGKSAGTLGETIMTIGLSNLVAVVCVAALTNHVLGKEIDRELLRHMLAVSSAAGSLCEKVSAAKLPKEYCVVAGLMHDVGKLILFDHAPSRYQQVRDEAVKGRKPFVDAEDSLLGLNHCTAGGALSEKWNFPPLYQSVIRHHHDRPIKPKPESASDALLYLIRLADKIAFDAGIGYGTSTETEKDRDALTGVLGVDKDFVTALIKEIKSAKALDF